MEDRPRLAYGIEWADDLSGSADQGNRFTICTRPWPEPDLGRHAVGADSFLSDRGTEDFLVCLSRQSLEAVAKGAGIQPPFKRGEPKVRLMLRVPMPGVSKII